MSVRKVTLAQLSLLLRHSRLRGNPFEMEMIHSYYPLCTSKIQLLAFNKDFVVIRNYSPFKLCMSYSLYPIVSENPLAEYYYEIEKTSKSARRI